MNDKMREEFETWAKSKYMPLRLDSTGEYWVETTQSAWEGWRQSRAALVIELPQGGYFAGYDNERMMESRDVREAIEAVGVKVKP